MNGTFPHYSRYPTRNHPVFGRMVCHHGVCENFLTASLRHHVFNVMRQRHYSAPVVDIDPDRIPVWLKVRLQRWLANIVREPPPKRFVRLLRKLKDDSSR
jgi:hypothetical protein